MSRFAGLRIEDDSEEDEFTSMFKGSKKAATGSAKGRGGPSAASKSRAKPKGAPHKKPKAQEATAAEWEEMDQKIVKGQFEADLRKAIDASKITAEEEVMISQALEDESAAKSSAAAAAAAPSPKKKSSKKKAAVNGDEAARPPANPASSASPTHKAKNGPLGGGSMSGLAAETESEVRRILNKEDGRGPNVESVLVNLYRDKVETAGRELEELRSEKESLKAESDKYKGRYKKLCELLKETEVKEKAQLIVEVEKGAKVREELAQEIGSLSAQLAQATSRLAALEGKHPE